MLFSNTHFTAALTGYRTIFGFSLRASEMCKIIRGDFICQIIFTACYDQERIRKLHHAAVLTIGLQKQLFVTITTKGA